MVKYILIFIALSIIVPVHSLSQKKERIVVDSTDSFANLGVIVKTDSTGKDRAGNTVTLHYIEVDSASLDITPLGESLGNLEREVQGIIMEYYVLKHRNAYLLIALVVLVVIVLLLSVIIVHYRKKILQINLRDATIDLQIYYNSFEEDAVTNWLKKGDERTS